MLEHGFRVFVGQQGVWVGLDQRQAVEVIGLCPDSQQQLVDRCPVRAPGLQTLEHSLVFRPQLFVSFLGIGYFGLK